MKRTFRYSVSKESIRRLLRQMGDTELWITITDEKPRTKLQNALWAVWYVEIARASGKSAGEIKAQLKQKFAVDLVRADIHDYNQKLLNIGYDQFDEATQIDFCSMCTATSLLKSKNGAEYTELIRAWAIDQYPMIKLMTSEDLRMRIYG